MKFLVSTILSLSLASLSLAGNGYWTCKMDGQQCKIGDVGVPCSKDFPCISEDNGCIPLVTGGGEKYNDAHCGPPKK
ncbi:hypothetical protein Ptr902_02581 [Pyrenophora tritici-repentis]|nr:hypothetical protein PtrV1_09191 [Pyrenophora tritici-repentis]KAF7442056.1 hypothetical protein A1F99_139080 [Pyrenophora tritici-repentis]KAI0568293.1 hypothetical protein Alg215_12249 [Pyrenophora tritici-repentis]KAI0578277.1 hypothetical protein Alg130_08025 [Pyrenophora tritici-repentis]KAI0604369.1 hypothetical protein TUN205_11386 [Pyrenophora tritici-repentis]